jgi:formylglycine-generating enzyme required for sulfatase activity
LDRTLQPIAWFCGNSGRPEPVGQKQPNAWGLYDMLGNVYEWTWDRYGTTPSSSTDPRGPTEGSGRVVRGGSHDAEAQFSRAAYRVFTAPGYRSVNLGFRPARTAP